MNVTKKITIDLNRPKKNMVHLGQGDSFTRWIELTLLCDGIPYDPTADLDALGIQDGSDADIIKTVKYIKANGISGEYEKIPENGTTPAVALMDGETNVYIVRLDEHATDVPGFAEVFVTFYVEDSDGDIHVLHSFPITIDVVQNTTNATDPGSPYYNIHSFYVKPVGGIPATDLAPDARGLSNDAKEALLACFAHVAWADEHGQDYYDALEDALYPEVKLVSITADYQQDRPIYDTDDLDAIKASDDLTVTANYSDGTSVVLDDDDYTLSGTLTVGTSTVTVTYGGKTTTFTVTVTESGGLPAGYEEADCIVNPIGRASGPYLDTGLTLAGTGDVVVDISFMSYGGETNPYVIGCLSSTSANTIGLGISIQSDYSSIIVFPGTVTSIMPSVVRGVKHNITATVTSTGATITDGTLTDTQTFTPRDHNVAPLYLFGIKKYNSTDVVYPFTGRIYSCTVTEGGVKKLELIPCTRISDGVAGFYDTVSGSFIGDSSLVAVPKNTTNTVANIASYDKIFVHYATDPKFREDAKTNGGTTVLYDMDSATTTLYPAGIIPTESTTVISSATASLFIYDANGDPVSYVNEYDRWAKNVSGTMTEFSNSWTIANGYSKIAFSLDTRYLESAYMYDKTTGQIWFAGAATPYYGMSNISEAT